MTVNYVLSFCKITAASKIFSRNFYLPLLKPLSPKDAARTFKIADKCLLGARRQHYIPVLHNHKKKRSKKCQDFGKMAHEIEYDYTYMTPILDPENESHRSLMGILQTKEGHGMFVYTVDDKKYNLVLDATIELAIRDGEIIDVMVSQRNDKLLLKLKDYKKIPLEIDYYEGEDELYRGEGATTEEEEKNHHHGKNTMSLAKIFEEKERLSEEWVKQLKKIIKKRKKQAGEGTIEWNEMVQEGISKLDWSKLEKEAKKLIEQIGDSMPERHIEMEVQDFELTRYVCEVIAGNGPEMINALPTMKEINEVVKSMPTAVPYEIEADLEETVDEEPKPASKRRVSGVMVKLPSGRDCFVTGQMVRTDDGEVFVPGQTIENDFGTEYAPGITINLDNKPTLITGLIMAEEQNEPIFLPTESNITKEGQLTFAMTPQERPKLPPKRFRSKFKKNKTNGLKELENPEQQDVQLPMELLEEENTETVEIKPNKTKKKNRKKRNRKISEEEEQENPDGAKEKEIKIYTLVENLTIENKMSDDVERVAAAKEPSKERAIDDGLEQLVATLEEKKIRLQQKLEELRKLTVNTEDTSITYVNSDDADEIALKITDDKDVAQRLSDIFLTLTRRSAAFRDRHSVDVRNISSDLTCNGFSTEVGDKFKSCSNNLKILLKSGLYAANDVFKTRPKDQLLALQVIADVLTDTLKKDEQLLHELLQLMNTNVERNEIPTTIFKHLSQDVMENKADSLRAAINGCLCVLDKIGQVLDKEGDLTKLAFMKMIKVNPALLKIVLSHVSQQIEKVTSEAAAEQILQNSIVCAVRHVSENDLNNYLKEKMTNGIADFFAEVSSFALALGLNETADEISRFKTDPNFNENTMRFLRRFMVIKQLAERDYSMKSAIERIRKKPECAKSDPRIRQLIRESAALISDASRLKTSRDIPLRLIKSQNHLAIEDFLIRRSWTNFPVLVSRTGLQIVIPEEATKGVLAGRVSYVLMDESDVVSIKPLRMLSALKMNGICEKRLDDRVDNFNRRASGDDEMFDKKTLAWRKRVRKMCKKLLNNRRQFA